MKKNIGSTDRVLRLLGAMVIAILYGTAQITGTVAIVLGIIGVLLLVTSLMAYCPVYPLFGFSTRKMEKKLNIHTEAE